MTVRRSWELGLCALLLGCGGAGAGETTTPSGPAAEAPVPPADAWTVCGLGAPWTRPSEGVRLRIEHEDAIGRPLVPTGLAYAVDGHCIRRWGADELSAEPGPRVVLDGPASPGAHRIDLYARYRLRTGLGIFAIYVRSYVFEIRSSHVLELSSPRLLRVTAYERGSVTTSFEERPAVRWEEHGLSGARGSRPDLSGARLAAPAG